MRYVLLLLAVLFVALLAFLRFSPKLGKAIAPPREPEIRSDEIRLEGKVLSVSPDRGVCVLKVKSFSLPNGKKSRLAAPRVKRVIIARSTSLRVRGERSRVTFWDVQPGVQAIAVGRDAGSGKGLSARELMVWDGEKDGRFFLSPAPVIYEEKRTVTVRHRKYSVRRVCVRLDTVSVKVGIAKGQVGYTDSLAGIAKRYGAVAGINGCYFDAYTSSPIKVPYMSFITDGYLIYRSRIGPMIGFTSGNAVAMDSAPWAIAYFRGWRESGLNLRRSQRLWPKVREAMGGGPRLLTDGKLTVYPEYEGFSHPKVLYLSCQRSAVGVSKDRKWLILVTTQGTMRQLGDVMWAVGCHDAMSLDGGASSGLWVRGHYLTIPGRKISNALLVVKRNVP